MNARESVNKIFSDILTEQNFCSASCFEKNEEPFFYSVKDGICTERRTRTRRQLKSGLLKNEMTISDGIEAFTNKLTDDKFYSFELNIKNNNQTVVFISIEFDKKLNACFSIFNKDFDEYDDIIHIDCNLDDAELFISKLHAAILLFDI